MWCLKSFYESLNGLHKTFSRRDKEVIKLELMQLSEMNGAGRAKKFIQNRYKNVQFIDFAQIKRAEKSFSSFHIFQKT